MKRPGQASQPMMLLGPTLAALIWVASIWMTGCSRQLGVPESVETAKVGQLPFDRVSDSSGISPTAGFAFDGIPAGTELTIRLQSALSSANSRAGDSFPAVVDEPVIVAGKTVVPRGATVTGSIVAAKASGQIHDPGYLRVTLMSIVVNGKDVPLRTSSLFAKGGLYGKRAGPTMNVSATESHSASAGSTRDPVNSTEAWVSPGHGDVKFSTGHRLTFRVTQSLHPQG